MASTCRSGWSMRKSRRSRKPRASMASSATPPISNSCRATRLTDAEVREFLPGGLLQRLVLTPIATATRFRLEWRPLMRRCCSKRAKAKRRRSRSAPSSPGSSQPMPKSSISTPPIGARYMVPEQRILRIARMDMQQVAGVTASDQEIAAYYNANKATYAPKESAESARRWCRTRRRPMPSPLAPRPAGRLPPLPPPRAMSRRSRR